jgi:glycosyltransferase involved in cell wall biosynthesis
MKVLQIVQSMDPATGGVCAGIRSTNLAMLKMGFKPEVVCYDNPDSHFLKNDPFKVHSLGSTNLPAAYHKDYIPWLKSNVLNYDVIIINGLWQYHSYATIRVILELKNRGIRNLPKVYIMPHGMLDPWFQRDKSRRLKALRNEIYWRLIERKVVNSADGLLFTCEEELLLARGTFKGYDPKKEINIGYGIENPPIQDLSMHPAISGNKYWLFLSRIHPKKGVDLLVKAYQELEEKYSLIPDLVIAGPLDSSYAKDMVKLSNSKKIHFTGLLQGNAKWGAFYNCEVFVLPSHQENFGIAVVEALACGIPVLISNKVNIYREIVDGGGGIVKEDTLEGTINLLNDWLELTKEQRQEMQMNSKKVFKRHFFSEKVAEKLIDALK